MEGEEEIPPSLLFFVCCLIILLLFFFWSCFSRAVEKGVMGVANLRGVDSILASRFVRIEIWRAAFLKNE